MNPGSEDAVREALQGVSSLARSVSFRLPADNLICVVGIGARLWDRMYDLPRPKGLHPLEPIVGATQTAVSTPGDLLLHLRAEHVDMCFELARQIVLSLEGHVKVVDEVHGFMFFDDRDLLGFVDGSENPEGRRAVDTVTIGDEDPAYAGGSYVIVQRYQHDLGAWGALSVEDQEKAIGRSKLENIEMPDDVKPSNSHVALNTIHDADGNQLQIVRDNLPFGSIGDDDFGTYFIGYAKDPPSPSRCCATCSSVCRRVTTTGSSTSPPP
ncbi:Dyp-type peroxidase [Arsenicicoccus piscis]|nr:Dyp-type peroxidase [Arsenicicoccus piscis]